LPGKAQLPVPFAHALNVVAGPRSVSQAAAGAIATAAGKAARIGEIDWLAPARSFDLPFDGDPDAVRAALREAAEDDWLLDFNIVAKAGRRKHLLIADMDSTIIGCECIDELADMAGIKPKVAAITERAMRGELDFPAALRERIALLRGLPLEAVARVYAERVRLNKGAKTLTATMRAHGARTLLVSGGFTYFTSRVAKDAGFEHNQGNRLLDDGKTLTGLVGEPILGREAKLAALEQAVARFHLSLADTLAVGDGANDLDMIGRAGLGVAYHAKPVVAAAAGTAIAHGDLTGLLYLQGYRVSEFTAP
jgi:phosphoserine phosphatase